MKPLKPSTMKKTLLAILLTIVLVGVPLAILSYNQFLAIDNLNNEIMALQAQVDASKGQMVSSESILWDGRTFTLEHMCEGNVQQAQFPGTEEVSYCLGANRLQLKNESGDIFLLTDSEVDEAADAPILSNVYLIPGTEDGRILLSYGPNDCATVNNCGVGYAPFTEWMVSLPDATSKLLENIPTASERNLIWNANGTKALVAISTGSGAGYSLTQIMGYDWMTDTITPLTTEEAAYGEPGTSSVDTGSFTDVTGTQLPYWDLLDESSWTDLTHIKVTLNNVDGTKQELTGSFE